MNFVAGGYRARPIERHLGAARLEPLQLFFFVRRAQVTVAQGFGQLTHGSEAAFLQPWLQIVAAAANRSRWCRWNRFGTAEVAQFIVGKPRPAGYIRR